MPTFDASGVEINYIVEGDGPAIVLVHGFTSDIAGNWRATGILGALTSAGRRVVALDCRGHGRSGKPYDPAAYEGTAMADDVIALMDHVGVDLPDLMGYSMGGFISLSLLARKQERFNSVILGGVGDLKASRARRNPSAMAEAMEAPNSALITDTTVRAFRLFAEAQRADLKALAAMQRASSHRNWFDPSMLANVTLPVMVLVGEDDNVIGAPEALAAAIPAATLVKTPGDHITALIRPEFKQAILVFLALHSPVLV